MLLVTVHLTEVIYEAEERGIMPNVGLFAAREVDQEGLEDVVGGQVEETWSCVAFSSSVALNHENNEV